MKKINLILNVAALSGGYRRFELTYHNVLYVWAAIVGLIFGIGAGCVYILYFYTL